MTSRASCNKNSQKCHNSEAHTKRPHESDRDNGNNNINSKAARDRHNNVNYRSNKSSISCIKLDSMTKDKCLADMSSSEIDFETETEDEEEKNQSERASKTINDNQLVAGSAGASELSISCLSCRCSSSGFVDGSDSGSNNINSVAVISKNQVRNRCQASSENFKLDTGKFRQKQSTINNHSTKWRRKRRWKPCRSISSDLHHCYRINDGSSNESQTAQCVGGTNSKQSCTKFNNIKTKIYQSIAFIMLVIIMITRPKNVQSIQANKLSSINFNQQQAKSTEILIDQTRNGLKTMVSKGVDDATSTAEPLVDATVHSKRSLFHQLNDSSIEGIVIGDNDSKSKLGTNFDAIMTNKHNSESKTSQNDIQQGAISYLPLHDSYRFNQFQKHHQHHYFTQNRQQQQQQLKAKLLQVPGESPLSSLSKQVVGHPPNRPALTHDGHRIIKHFMNDKRVPAAIKLSAIGGHDNDYVELGAPKAKRRRDRRRLGDFVSKVDATAATLPLVSETIVYEKKGQRGFSDLFQADTSVLAMKQENVSLADELNSGAITTESEAGFYEGDNQEPQQQLYENLQSHQASRQEQQSDELDDLPDARLSHMGMDSGELDQLAANSGDDNNYNQTIFGHGEQVAFPNGLADSDSDLSDDPLRNHHHNHQQQQQEQHEQAGTIIEQVDETCEDKSKVLATRPNFTIGLIFAINYSIIFIFGLLGNVITLFVLTCKGRRCTVQDILIANLACSDVMLCVFAVPVTPKYLISDGYWTLGPTLCKLVSFAQSTSVYMSTYSLICIGYIRYRLIIHPLEESMSKRTALLFVLGTWLVGITVTLPYTLSVKLIPESCEFKYCDETWEQPFRFLFSLFTVSFQFMIPLGSVGFFNRKIYSKLDDRSKNRQQTDSSGSTGGGTSRGPTTSTILAENQSIMFDETGQQSQSQLQPTQGPTIATKIIELNNGNGNQHHHHIHQRNHSFSSLIRSPSSITGNNTNQTSGGGSTSLAAATRHQMDVIAIREQRKREKEKRMRKANGRLMIVVLAFAHSWLPLNMFNLVQDYFESVGNWHYHTHLFLVAHQIACSSVCWNPILYAWMSETYRQDVRNALPRFLVARFRCLWDPHHGHHNHYHQGMSSTTGVGYVGGNRYNNHTTATTSGGALYPSSGGSGGNYLNAITGNNSTIDSPAKTVNTHQLGDGCDRVDGGDDGFDSQPAKRSISANFPRLSSHSNELKLANCGHHFGDGSEGGNLSATKPLGQMEQLADEINQSACCGGLDSVDIIVDDDKDVEEDAVDIRYNDEKII